MNTIGWGVALIVIGLILTFTNVFGFFVGVPLVWIGLVVIAVGVVLAIMHFVSGTTNRTMTRRGGI